MRKIEPTTKSFLDTDMYKLTMGQFAFHRYANAPVKYAFKNRTKGVGLIDTIDERELRNELDSIQYLQPTTDELNYLATIKNGDERMFKDDYLNFLANIKLPDYSLGMKDGDFTFEAEGPWSTGIYWETPGLAIFNGLHYKGLTKNMSVEQFRALAAEGESRLERKIKILQENPNAKFMEFGTRRRFSQAWQEKVTREMQTRVPDQITGTSNVYLAKKLGLTPKGTMAHEMFMVMSGIMHGNDDEIRASHNQVLQEWEAEYGLGLSIALTDTYGSDFFFKDMTNKQARDWRGLRQDSGSPAGFAEKQIAFYEAKAIDSRTKLFVPSDGLEIESVVGLPNQFGHRIKTEGGWGTSLTNDLGLPSLSLVMKAVESNGHGTVKLSDNPAKATGTPENIARFKRIFGYDDTKYTVEVCKY